MKQRKSTLKENIFQEKRINLSIALLNAVRNQCNDEVVAILAKKDEIERVFIQFTDQKYNLVFGYSALHYAVRHNNEKLVFILLDLGFNLDYQDKGEHAISAFALAFQEERSSLIIRLIKKGFRPNDQLFIASAKKNRWDFLIPILNELPDDDKRRQLSAEVMHIAITVDSERFNKQLLMQCLLKLKPDLTFVENGHTLIEAAAFANLWSLVDKLVNQKTDSDKARFDRVLLLAMSKRKFPTAKKLVKVGASLNFSFIKKKKEGRNILTHAIYYDQYTLLELFLKKGADPDKISSSGELTPIEFAFKHQKPVAIKMLLLAGAKPDYSLLSKYMADKYNDCRQAFLYYSSAHDTKNKDVDIFSLYEKARKTLAYLKGEKTISRYDALLAVFQKPFPKFFEHGKDLCLELKRKALLFYYSLSLIVAKSRKSSNINSNKNDFFTDEEIKTLDLIILKILSSMAVVDRNTPTLKTYKHAPHFYKHFSNIKNAVQVNVSVFKNLAELCDLLSKELKEVLLAEEKQRKIVDLSLEKTLKKYSGIDPKEKNYAAMLDDFCNNCPALTPFDDKRQKALGMIKIKAKTFDKLAAICNDINDFLSEYLNKREGGQASVTANKNRKQAIEEIRKFVKEACATLITKHKDINELNIVWWTPSFGQQTSRFKI